MNAAYEAIVSCAGLFACWVLWFYFFREYRIDRFRNNLFGFRDDLFNLAVAGEIEFQNPAYVQLRDLLNGMIRFAHRANSYNVFLAVRFRGDIPEEATLYHRWKTSLEKLPPKTAEKLEKIHERMLLTVTSQIISGSVCLSAMSVFIFFRLLFRALKQILLGSRRWKRSSPGKLTDSVVRNMVKNVRTSVLEEEAYRSESASPGLTWA